MRYLIACLILSCCSIAEVRAEEEIQGRVLITSELVDAHIAYKAAQARVRNYQHIVLPQARRALNEQIRLTETEINVLRGRLRDYRRFLRVGEYSPVRTAAESHLLSLVDAEQRLRKLKDDRIALMRTTRQQFDMQNLEIVRAAARLAEVKRGLREE